MNRLKKWFSPDALVLRVVVTDEEKVEPIPSPRNIKMVHSQLSVTQKLKLEELIDEFKDVITTQIGKTVSVEHSIETGDHQPIRTLPYRLAPHGEIRN